MPSSSSSSFLDRYRQDPEVRSEATRDTPGLRESLQLHWDKVAGRAHVVCWAGVMRPRPILPCLQAFWRADDRGWHDVIQAGDMRSPLVRTQVAARWRQEGPTEHVISTIYLKMDGLRHLTQLVRPLLPDFLRRALYKPHADQPVFLLDVWMAHGAFDDDEHVRRVGELLLGPPSCSAALNLAGRFAPHLRAGMRDALEHVAQQTGTFGHEARRLMSEG
jgi:hypothetical protein